MTRVLLIDDEPNIRDVLSRFLAAEGIESTQAGTAEAGLEALAAEEFDAVVSDIVMPGMSGIEVLEKIHEIDPELPVMMLTGQPSIESAAHAVSNKAFDYLLKPTDRATFVAAVRRAIAYSEACRGKARLQAENETYRRHLEDLVLQRTAALEDANRVLRLEVEQRRRAEEAVQHVSLHDATTDLPNRILFKDRLQGAMDAARRVGERNGPAVLLAELKGGHHAARAHGDLAFEDLLRQFVRRLEAVLPEDALVARLGGAEFAFLLPEAVGDLNDFIRKITHLASQPYILKTSQLTTGILVGVNPKSLSEATAEQALQNAYLALEQARVEEDGKPVYYSPLFRRDFNARFALEERLREAVFRMDLRPAYQGIVDLRTGEPVAYEALARWEDGNKLVGPDQFIPLAEENGLILQVGEFMLEKACRQLAEWTRVGGGPLRVHVNVSARQLIDRSFVGALERILHETSIDPDDLVLELTESVFYRLGSQAVLNDIKTLGVRLCLDDFGKGYSSLSYLRRLPVSIVKLDRAFVDGVATDPRAKALVKAVMGMAEAFGLEFVAEGIEDEEQRQMLLSMGCVRGQGYLFGKPQYGARISEQWHETTPPIGAMGSEGGAAAS